MVGQYFKIRRRYASIEMVGMLRAWKSAGVVREWRPVKCVSPPPSPIGEFWARAGGREEDGREEEEEGLEEDEGRAEEEGERRASFAVAICVRSAARSFRRSGVG